MPQYSAPSQFSRRNVLRLGAASAAAVAGVALGGAQVSASPLHTAAVAAVRPTGPGIYAYENLGVRGLNLTAGMAAAMAAARREGRSNPTLTLPNGIFESAGFGQSANNTTFLVPETLSLIGSGPGTIIRTIPNTMTAAQAATIPTAVKGPTNPLRVLLIPKGTGIKMSQFTVQGTPQNGKLYQGVFVYRCNNSIFSDIKVMGIPGSFNAPPGETYALQVHNGTGNQFLRVDCDGRDTSGKRVGAVGIAFTDTSNHQLRDCYTHHHAYSHGLVTWQSSGITTWNHRSEYNGSTGNGGWRASGINHEKSRNTIHYGARLGNNTLSEVRYYAQPASGGDPYSGDTGGHQIRDSYTTDGGTLDILLDYKQTTRPAISGGTASRYVTW